MFNSQYYTCEQVDERLLQGYVDDFNEVNSTNYSKEDLLLKLFQAINWDQVFGKYEESSEFVRVYLDVNQKLLWGIRSNGDIYYGAGVPSQIRDYIDSKIKELHLDKVDDILVFLDDLLDSDKTLKELLEELDNKVDEKVDKEEGKSLIDADFASGITYIESPEFKEVKFDANDKILEAIYNDGTKLFGAGVKVNGDARINGDINAKELKLQSLVTNTIENPEFKAVWTIGDKILFGIQNDGNFLFGCGVPRQIEQYIRDVVFGGKDVTTIIDTLNEITIFLEGFASGSNLLEYLNNTYGYYEESQEYRRVLLDDEERIIEATKEDGTKVLPAGLETPKENVGGIIIETVSDSEYIEARVDSDGKMYFGARRDGDIIVGGVNINEMKRDLDVEAIEVEYNPEDHSIYVTENVDSAIGLEYDSETGDLYQVNDSRVTADITMDETGNVYIEQ